MQVLDLLECLKPCSCGTIVETGELLLPGGLSKRVTLTEIDVCDLKDVRTTHLFDTPNDVAMDNLDLFCPTCGASWIQWNYLLDARLQAKLGELPID